MIIRALCAMVSNVRPHEERLESEAISPNFFLNEPLDADVDQRYYSCHILFKGSFQCECAICSRQRDRNVVFWSEENPHFTQELEHNAPHVIIWAGMTLDYLTGL
jgi:hypothetical protein